MTTRTHRHEILLAATPEEVFALLTTPSAIRGWWGAARVVLEPREGGIWAAAWGAREDDPEYVWSATIERFEPGRRLRLGPARYYAREGGPAVPITTTTEFTIEARPGGALLRVEQAGFPIDPAADAHFAACENGWRATFAAIERRLR